MDYKIGDPFDGRSPDSSNLQEPDVYDDLLGAQIVVDDVDLPMIDFQEEHAPKQYTAPIANMVVQKDHNSSDEREGIRTAMMNLSNLGAKSMETRVGPSNNLETTTILSQQTEEHANSKSHDSDLKELETSRPVKQAVTIKQEPIDMRPFTSGIAINTIEDAIEISDIEDPDSIYKHDIEMSGGVVTLPDDENPEEIMIFDVEPNSKISKKRDSDVESQGAATGPVEVSDSENYQLTTAPFPRQRMAFLRRPSPTAKCTSAEIQKMHRIQSRYAKSALGKNPIPGARRAIVSPKTVQTSDPEISVPIKKEDGEVEFLWERMGDRTIELDSDSEPSATSRLNLGESFLKGLDPKRNCPELAVDEDMGIEYAPDEDHGKTFRALKKSYNAKVKVGSTTMEDEIEFARAEKKERLRLARLKAKYENDRGYSDDEDSDNGLFLSPAPAGTSHRKRPADNGSDAEDEDPDSQSAKLQRKQNSSSKRTQREELEMNMLAGIAEFHRKKSAEEGEASERKGRGKNRTEDKGSKKVGPKRTRRKLNKGGCLNGVSSLLTSNVYEDAEANLNREALPISGHTHKDKALAAFVASVPLGTTKKDATTEKNRLQEATRILGRNIRGYCKADGSNGWKLPGLRLSLENHQVIGAGFMVDRETGGEEPLGGILADGMGLGKTVTTLALCIANPPPRDEKHRATLIVCTPALLVQWEREIDKHTEANHFHVLKHYSSERVAGNARVHVMQSQDIILTTYQEVVKSYPKFQVPEDVHGEDQRKAWEKQWNQERDVLHQVLFYRIVLDESQAIKNHKSQTSIACRALMGKLRWTLSGTPISNKVEELYPYCMFLRVPYTGSFRDFQKNYCKDGSNDSNSRLHCIIDQIILRRTHKDTIFGAPIVKLPKHNQRTINIEFSPVEKAIYRRVFKKLVGQLNKASENGSLKKYPGYGLHAFLRLRQMCAHTFLVQEVLEELLDLESIDNMEQDLICGETLENRNDRYLLAALRRMIKAQSQVIEEDPQESEQEQIPQGELAAKFSKYLKTLKADSKWVEFRARTTCHSCGDRPESPMVTTCLHVYCGECLQGIADEAAAKDQSETACLECGVTFGGAEPCDDLKELEWDEAWFLKIMAGRKKRPKKINMEWVFCEDRLVMSAKIKAVQTQIEEWLEKEPDKKIIIFSQFHMIMQVLELVCQKKKWKYCTYNGKMSHKARDEAIKNFKEASDMKIMIASLKCGGIGLNLTMASKVICIDLWYNNCAEQQAFCRVFRIGQDSETFVTRFVVSESADDRLMEMQLKKTALIHRAIEDKSVMSKLTINDVLRLFGDVSLDKNMRPFIQLEENEKLDRLFEKKGQD